MNISKKQIREKVVLLCDNIDCKKKYSKDLSEYSRNQRLKRANYCSRNCASKVNNVLQRPEIVRVARKANERRYRGHISQSDGMKTHLRRLRKRSKDEGKVFDVDLEYLHEIWNKQGGKCIYTHVSLIHPHYKTKKHNRIYTASLDRIDSSKWYIKGNVQFVSMCINYMKSTLTDIETKQLISIIKG